MPNITSRGRRLRSWVVALALIAGASQGATAEEVAKKLRLSLSVGAYESQDEIRNGSANVLTVLNDEGEIDHKYIDPRDDEAVSGDLKIQGGPIATLALQYAVNHTFILEASGGYNSNDVGDIEVQSRGELARFPAGELTRIPLELTALARLRPSKKLNPYFGGGLGYTFVGFEPSEQLDEFSLNLDRSWFRQARLAPDTRGSVTTIAFNSRPEQLSGVTVDAGNTWEWHVVGGAEFSIARRWCLFLDLRYSEASTDFRLQYNGQDDIGVQVPQGQTTVGSDLDTRTYGEWFVFPGGLIDWDGDGVPDQGLYYAQGGTLEYDGLTAQFGVRYTF